MGQTTDEKLAKLGQIFPEYDEAGLLDVLVSCDGSVKRSARFLGRDDNEANVVGGYTGAKRLKSQQTLSRFLKGTPSEIKSGVDRRQGKVIDLHTKDEIEKTLRYCSYHTDVLPNELADGLLRSTMNDPGYKASQFYLFGNKCVSNHKSRLFLPESRKEPFFYNGHEVKDYGWYGDEMMLAQVIIEDLVNVELTKRKRLPFQVKPGEWVAQAALSNSYNEGSNLDWHSDRMTNIGPHPVIASLSLGFSREFRIRKGYPSNSQIYSIRPKHNSLIIMHAGFQEEYKHCVPLIPKRSKIPTDDLNPISHTKRINITYRNYLLKNTIFCKDCGSAMDLRRMFKDPQKRGRYFYLCSRSYTEANGFKDGNECKGFSYANFQNDPPLTDNEDHCSSWIAEDDHEAIYFRDQADRSQMPFKSST
ncbi:LADA_0H00386g1_1 [Lachancea dasiensis]|uniref:LADA_0H00386g1_1 n=1 Tax=Lachancea dasiensis TaxID=1072105 RepID=A0A1G4JYR0_9SACH|nr:LADA_0H00386g1_1 [Lachancea dasiensis]